VTDRHGPPWLLGSDRSKCFQLPSVHDDCRSLVIYKGSCLSVTGQDHLLICFFVLFAFGYSNRASAPQDSGMSVDSLAWAITAALGILTASTSVAVSYLFSLGSNPNNSTTPPTP